jgi:hypothetical protein
VANDLCPLDLLTQFRGAADIPPTGDKGNSIYFPVVNHPLPTASATVGQYGWVNSTTANVNFAANAATYSSPSVTANNPFPSFPYNGFVAAPVYSVTYGITQAGSPLPDTTYPVPGDITVWNNYTQENFANPLCNYMGTTPSSFSPTESILSLTASQSALLPDGLRPHRRAELQPAAPGVTHRSDSQLGIVPLCDLRH